MWIVTIAGLGCPPCCHRRAASCCQHRKPIHGIIVALNIRSGGGTRAAYLRSYLDQLDPHTVLLTEWRDNVGGAGTPPKEMAFGSTTLSAIAHSSQRVPQSALAITARATGLTGHSAVVVRIGDIAEYIACGEEKFRLRLYRIRRAGSRSPELHSSIIRRLLFPPPGSAHSAASQS